MLNLTAYKRHKQQEADMRFIATQLAPAQEHELSINEILEKWLDKHRIAMRNQATLGFYCANSAKNMVAGAVVSAIRHQADYDLTRETKILIEMINSHQVPNAIGCKELMSEDEYFNIFVSRLKEIDAKLVCDRLVCARSSNYNSRTTYTAQAA